MVRPLAVLTTVNYNCIVLGSCGFIVTATVYAFTSVVHAFFPYYSTLGGMSEGEQNLLLKIKLAIFILFFLI